MGANRPTPRVTGPAAQFAAQLRRLRDSAGFASFTNQELATRTGVPLSSVGEALRGRCVPNWKTLSPLVELFGGDLHEWSLRRSQAVGQRRRANADDGAPVIVEPDEALIAERHVVFAAEDVVVTAENSGSCVRLVLSARSGLALVIEGPADEVRAFGQEVSLQASWAART